MSSIRSIGVVKLRHKQKQPNFNHAIVNLIQRLNGTKINNKAPREKKKDLEEAKFTSTVIIENKNGESQILTPFIIDVNAFDTGEKEDDKKENKRLAKIYHFSSYAQLPEEERYRFNHINNLSENENIKCQKTKGESRFNKVNPYQIIIDQFENFKETFL